MRRRHKSSFPHYLSAAKHRQKALRCVDPNHMILHPPICYLPMAGIFLHIFHKPNITKKPKTLYSITSFVNCHAV